jgi:hypothetical protein
MRLEKERPLWIPTYKGRLKLGVEVWAACGLVPAVKGADGAT